MLKRFWMGILTILCSIGITIAISYAWFVKSYDVDPLAKGSSAEAYYHSGSGTKNDPFIITTQRHLYNLAWLQYLGTYNKPTTNGGTTYESTYFKLGTTENGTLDMTGWPLPPIGTAKYPFIGNFNGNGWTISNLTTTNNFTEFGDKHPSGITADGANGTDAFEQANCGTIGFFGAIGAYNNSVISDTVTTNTSGVSYPTTTNTATNFYLNNTSVHTSISSTILGAVAGYVNATLSQVGVIQPHLNIQASASAKLGTNLSDFAVVGYAESQYTTQKTKSSTIIYNPTTTYDHFNFQGMGSGNDWGGSLNFANTYQRINQILGNVSSSTNKYSSASSLTDYVGQEIQYYKIENGLSVLDTSKNAVQVQATSFTTFATSEATTAVKYKNYKNANGSYIRTCNTGDSDQYMTLTALYKDVIIVTKTEETENGYVIADSTGDYYLDISNTARSGLTFTVAINNSSENSRVWVLKNNKLYTYNEDDGKKYFLNASGTTVSLSTTGSTNWTYNSTNSSLSYTSSGNTYYLKRYNNTWCTTPLYNINDSSGNYIKLNGTTIQNTTDLSEATAWYASNSTNVNQPYGTFRAVNANGTNTNYYLTISGQSLIGSGTGTTWSNSGSGLYNGSNYIHYINGYWVASTNPSYKIGYSTHYLSTTGTDTTSDNAALWTFNNTLATSGGNGTISMVLNGTTNYLRNNAGTLQVSTTATTWYNDGGNKLYSYANNQTYYLEYDSGWKLTVVDYYIKDQNSNYLTYASPTSITNATSATTLWHFSNASDTYPNGTISCTQGGNTYYLNASGTSLVLSDTSNTTWSNDGDGLYCTINGAKYYLVYDSDWKLVIYTYKIRYGSNYLSIDELGNITNQTQEANATEWTFTNSGTNPSGIISSNGYYLYLNNGLLDTTTTDGNALSFNNAGSGLYDNANNYIQFYNNKWVCGKAFTIKQASTYLSYNNGTTANWQWFYYSDAATPQGYIYTVNNGQIYYLYSNGSTLSCDTTNKINWSRDDWGLYFNSNGNKYITYYSNNWTVRSTDYIGYKISDGNGHYINGNANADVSVGNATNATAWKVDSNNFIYMTVSGTDYYMYPNDDTWKICTTLNPNTTQQELQYHKEDRKIMYDNGGSRNNLWHINYSNYSNDWIESNNAFNLTWTEVFLTIENVTTNQNVNITSSTSTNVSSYVKRNSQSISLSSVSKQCTTSQASSTTISSGTTFVYTNSENDYTGTNALPSLFSAIPITTKGDKVSDPSTINYSSGTYYQVDESNTGYLISGGHETRKAADLRVSWFNQTGNGYDNMPSNLIESSFDGTTLGDIYTVKSIGTSTKIVETTNNGVQTNDCGFTKYFAAKQTLETTLKKNSAEKLYGAHFMNAPISKNKYILTTVSINNITKYNYQMPEDCIDFNLKSKGSINFFSSYFYYNTSDGGANNCFFSLNEIIRDSNGNISQIRHIRYVYERKSDHQYVYYYDDPDGSDSGYYYRDSDGVLHSVSYNSSDYTLLFDSNWIEDPANSGVRGKRQSFFGTNGATNGKKIFYFEIPVCMGEFALGSVNKKDYDKKPYNGAYLLYLDIGANASVVDRTIITEQSVTNTKKLTYVNGVQLLATDTTYTSDANSAVAIIPTTETGTFSFSRNGDTITSSSLNSTYFDESLTCNSLTINDPGTDVTTKVLKYIDFNNGSNKLYYTLVKDVGGTSSWVCNEVNKNTLVVGDLISSSSYSNEQIKSAGYGLLKKGTSQDDLGYGVVYSNNNSLTAGLAISANTFNANDNDKLITYHFYTAYKDSNDALVTCTQDIDFEVAKVTGTKTINGYSITNGSLNYGDGYSLSWVFEPTGDIITMSFANVPATPTTTIIIVDYKNNSYTVTINGKTISVGNYTYTFSSNTLT